MPALNSLIWQQCHQIPILVSSVHHIVTVALVTLPPPSTPHHVTITINNDDNKSLTTQHSTTSHHYGPQPTDMTTTRAQDIQMMCLGPSLVCPFI